MKTSISRDGEDASAADSSPYPATPRWVYAFGISAIVVLATLFVIRHLTLGGVADHVH